MRLGWSGMLKQHKQYLLVQNKVLTEAVRSAQFYSDAHKNLNSEMLKALIFSKTSLLLHTWMLQTQKTFNSKKLCKQDLSEKSQTNIWMQELH